MDETCTVSRKCSSTGVACAAGDRACNNDATAHGLAVVCVDSHQGWVYCPTDDRRGDSAVVWILLGVAVTIAAVGVALAWVVLRKK